MGGAWGHTCIIMVKKPDFMKQHIGAALASLSISFSGFLDLLNPILETLTLVAGLVISGHAIYRIIKRRRANKAPQESL